MRHFLYKHGDTNLNFVINLGRKDTAEAFLKMLKQATADVEELVSTM